MKNILIGTMCGAGADTPAYIRYLGKLGFESTEMTFGGGNMLVDMMNGKGSLEEFAAQIKSAVDESKMEMSAVGLYANPLEDENARKCWELLIDNCHLFGTKLICGFTGCLTDKPIPEAIPQYKSVFSDLEACAREKGVRIAFENCNMGGRWQSARWNIAVNPDAWNLMFEALPSDIIGLEWEPAHQICQLIEPLPQLRKWAKKVFHVHGKDGFVDRSYVAEHGVLGGVPTACHRTPGFGITNWTEVIYILRQNGYEGNIDIEGWHDAVYGGELEMTGQVHGLHYLQNCRGESFVPAFR